MSATRKHWNPRLRRKLDRMVATQKQIDLLLGDTLKNLQHSAEMIDKMTPDYPPLQKLMRPPKPRPLCPGAWMYK